MISYIVSCIGWLLVCASFVPLIRHDYWLFRVFEYPRLQKLFLTFLLLLVICIFFFPVSRADWFLLIALSVTMIYLCYQVYPFTIFGRKQIVRSRKLTGDNSISMLIANVYQDNRQSADYHALVSKCNPDIILMVETNGWWDASMKNLETGYPFYLKAPLENTYGLLFYSRFPLQNGSVRYLVEKDIPSIETEVILPSGKLVKLYCLHPRPPVPQENPRSTERDKEILIVAKKAKESSLPVIVMGDLNDVAWSYTTELFGKISGLVDPRRGRGFYNSFNAKYPFVRFPLDHIFCSADFSLITLKRMARCGSDHFPMFIKLQFDPRAESQNEQPVASTDDKELAEEKIKADTGKD